ncbi:hypothetical protein HJFPF1_13005 [Paramyrothecium foliicola]|nr:hypothetical protein HJFPF1_13005 [Paramyrothecium foliicola]
MQHPLVSYQPLHLLFQLVYLASVLPHLPYFLVVASIPSGSPSPRWSFKQTFMTHVAYPMLDATSRVGVTETITLAKWNEGDRFRVVRLAAVEVYRDLWLRIQPNRRHSEEHGSPMCPM